MFDYLLCAHRHVRIGVLRLQKFANFNPARTLRLPRNLHFFGAHSQLQYLLRGGRSFQDEVLRLSSENYAQNQEP